LCVQTMDTVGRCIVIKRKGKVKRTKSDAYETSKQSQKYWNSTINSITCIVTHYQSEILLESL
jgi:hypothetical protein